jgi:hypothetical protein
MSEFRNNGAIGALLDEYERAMVDLQITINDITGEEMKTVVDPETKDPSCKSIQTILTHVIRSGYWYVTEVRMSLGEKVDLMPDKIFETSEEYHVELNYMFQCNEQLFEDYPDIKVEEYDNQKKIVVRWGQYYDVEQLFEHAIVHILRHRRQIEKFLNELR